MPQGNDIFLFFFVCMSASASHAFFTPEQWQQLRQLSWVALRGVFHWSPLSTQSSFSVSNNPPPADGSLGH